MDRTVLLLLLQVFLLVTAFSSADAAALGAVDHQQQTLDVMEGIKMDERDKSRKRAKRQCGWRRGACSSISGVVRPDRTIIKPTEKPVVVSGQAMK